MKKLLSLFLFLPIFTILYAQENAEKQLPTTLDFVIKMENPNAYQKAQLIKFFDDTVDAAQLEENKNGILEVINQELPASSIRSYYLKDAFPQAPETDPKGFFDSYNRALFAYSVLEALKQNEGVYIVDFGNQAFLTFKKTKKTGTDTDIQETVYIPPTEPEEIYHPSQEEIDNSNILYTQDDMKSLILTRMAQEKIKEGNGEEFSYDDPNVTILKQAEALLKEAIKLNPRNITALNEMKSLVNAIPQSVYNANPDKADKKKLEITTNYDMLILALKVANFSNGYEAKKLDPFVCNNTSYCPKKSQKSNPALFANAVQEDEEIRDLASNIMLSLYSLDMYKSMLYLGNEYAKIKEIDNLDNIYNFYFQMAVANAINRNYKNFQKFKHLFDAKYFTIPEENENLKAKLNNVAVAMEIVAGRKTPAKVAQDYNAGLGNRVYSYIVTGRLSDTVVESAVVLKGWPGYTSFRNQVLDIVE